MPPIELKDRPIAITGASSGIGRAAALLCAEAGMPVVCFARRIEKLESLVEEIRERGGRAVAVAGDVADPEHGRLLVDASMQQFGPLYSVFANAGYGVEAPIHEMSRDEFRRIFDVNFWGTIDSIKPALDVMIERGAGHLLICSSCVAKFALPYYGAYSATKAAQNHIGRAMRLELESSGVHVSTVHPVGTKTEFFDQAKVHSGRAALIEHSNELFMQTPERVARAVVRCLRKPRPEVWTSWPVRYGMAMSMAFPRISDRFIRHHLRQRLSNGD